MVAISNSFLNEQTQSFLQNLAYLMNKSMTTITGSDYSPAKEELYGGGTSSCIEEKKQ